MACRWNFDSAASLKHMGKISSDSGLCLIPPAQSVRINNKHEIKIKYLSLFSKHHLLFFLFLFFNKSTLFRTGLDVNMVWYLHLRQWRKKYDDI